ncbi:B12-binding domain-containing radical SAM protein [Serratia quinivorans]|uniref:B12-binding domain-containing radical SAM protein n=1 Tax=Serratia quinivorans TaxID=137545 RepID=UPI001C44D2DB|nr:radical SAM protein [Serratia quinivorans]MBV6695148.1 radical SAM protein [Serratia quinivorans]
MNVLIIIPPYIPSYFNAGHHLPIFQVSAYLRKNFPELTVKTVDAAALNVNWKNICELLTNNDFDFIMAMNDFDGIDTFPRFVHYCKKLSPQSKRVTFGRLSKQNPQVFEQFDFDAIHYSGDYEAGIQDYLLEMMGGSMARGFLSRSMAGYNKTGEGRMLNSEEWVFPDIKEIPYAHYDKMYLDDFNKFCGIPNRRELVVPVARGCSIGCKYCDVPLMQGRNERRVAVSSVVKYINDAFLNGKFEYITFYAPTFTLDKKWVIELCDTLIGQDVCIPWKCVTTLSFLDEKLIKKMSQANCIRISLGVETIEKTVAENSLPKVKIMALKKFDEISKSCQKSHIELNCFIMMGLPGDSIEGLKSTIKYVHDNNARYRPTIFTDYHKINDDMSVDDISLFNRQLFATRSYPDSQEKEYYRLFHGYEYKKITCVEKNIPVHCCK